VREMDTSGAAYQTALDDIRGTVRELERISAGVTWVSLHFLLWIGIVLLGGSFLLCRFFGDR